MTGKKSTTRKRTPKPAIVEDVKSIESWVDATVTFTELTSSKFAAKHGAYYWPRVQSWVATCADKNASFCSSTRLALYRHGKTKKLSRRAMKGLSCKSVYTSTEATEIETHSALELLANPNGMETGVAFAYLRFMAKQTCGNAWLYFTDDQLLTLRPMYVSHIADDTDVILKGWCYGRERVNEICIPADEVLQFVHRPSLENPFYGVPPLANCLADADLLNLATVAEVSRWKNEGRPPLAIKLPDTMNKEARAQAIKDFDRQVRGVKNTGRPLVMQFADIKPMGFAPKEMEYLSGQQVSERRVWAAYGIPESIIRPNEGSLAAATASARMYTEYTIWPLLSWDADELTSGFRRLGLIDENMFFCYDSPTQEDGAAELDAARKRADGGLITIDEWRAEEGLQPLPNGVGAIARYIGNPMGMVAAGDMPRFPMEEPVEGKAEVTVDPTVDATAKETSLNGAQVTALAGLAAQVAAATLPLETAISIARAAFPAIDEATMRGIFGPLKGFELPKEEPAPEPKPEKSIEPEMVKDAGSAGAIEARFASAVNGWLESIGQSVSAGVVEITGAQQAQLAAIVERFTVEAWNAGGKTEASKLGIAFNLPSSQAIAAVQAPNSLIIEQITGTTQEYIRTAVSTGLEQGQSYTQIASSLQESGLSPERAAVIARTETANATSAGATTFAVEEAGCDEKSWMLGGNPCEICIGIKAKVDAAGGWIPISEPFAEAGEFGNPEPIFRYPAHPNCTCDSNHRINPKGGAS